MLDIRPIILAPQPAEEAFHAVFGEPKRGLPGKQVEHKADHVDRHSRVDD